MRQVPGGIAVLKWATANWMILVILRDAVGSSQP
jgi:hypothetical protein